jgi:hypothetical protein
LLLFRIHGRYIWAGLRNLRNSLKSFELYYNHFFHKRSIVYTAYWSLPSARLLSLESCYCLVGNTSPLLLLVKEFHKTNQNNEKLIAKYAEPLYMKEPNPLGAIFCVMMVIHK